MHRYCFVDVIYCFVDAKRAGLSNLWLILSARTTPHRIYACSNRRAPILVADFLGVFRWPAPRGLVALNFILFAGRARKLAPAS